MPTRKGNISSGKNVTQEGSEVYKSFIANVMEPDHPFLLPRSVPTSAGVIFHKPQKSFVQDLDTSPSGYLVVKSNVDEMVTICTEMGPAANLPTPQHQPELGHSEDVPALYTVSVGEVKNVNGVFLGPYRVQRNGSLAIEKNGSLTLDVANVYDVTWSAGAKILTFVENFDYNMVGINMVIRDAVTGGSLGSAGFAEDGAGGYKAEFTLAAAGSNKLIIEFASRGRLQYSTRFTGTWTLAAQPMKVVYSLWDLLGNVEGAGTSKAQYLASEKYSITALSALLTNTTAVQFKSGSIVCAQLPGGSTHVLPGSPSEFYQFVASYNDPKTYTGQLNKGAHWFFSPEKIQDWFFRPITEPDGDRPYFVAAWTGVAVNDLANKLGLTLQIRVNIELLTADISLMKFSPTPDLARLMDLYVSMVSANSTLSENPNHMAKIKKIVNKIASSPYTKDALRSMAIAGTKLVPLALAAL